MGRRVVAIPAPTLALIVAAAMIALYGVDKFLAGQEQAELAQQARDRYNQGQALMHDGKAGAAIVSFARAHAIERSDREYQLALGTAQLADNQLSDAEETANELLAQDSNDGRANLLMARIMVAGNHFKDADSYYHRAIYGRWPSNAAAQPQNVRLELAKMLAEHGNQQEVLSELLLVDSTSGQDSKTAKQIAQLFLEAGSAQSAADVYRRLIRENRDDINAYLDLGHVEIVAGDYRAAESAVMSAERRQPYNARVQSELRLVAQLASLDPTSRRLSTAEKYRRSEAILDMAEAELKACRPDAEPAIQEKTQGPITNEMAEARLDQAERIWKQRNEACKQAPAADDPLPILLKKVAQ